MRPSAWRVCASCLIKALKLKRVCLLVQVSQWIIDPCRCAHAAVNIHGCVYMASLTTVRMAESSGGGPGSPTHGKLANIQKVACICCAAPLQHSR